MAWGGAKSGAWTARACLLVPCVALAVACGGGDGSTDGGRADGGGGSDARSGRDAGADDAGPADSGGRDAGDVDSGGGVDAGETDDGGAGGGAPRCPAPLPDSWIFCDDFESGDVASRYFEFSEDDGDFRRVEGTAASGSHSMEVVWQPGEVGAGGMKVTFGRNPIGTMHRTDEDFDEVYWRMRVRHEEGWEGSPAKLSRATAFSQSDWSQAMIAHLWSSGDVLIGDPAACVSGTAVRCSGYNDFDELEWLGQMPGSTPIFSTADSGRWRCVEGHVRLNTPGESDGVFEFWIDDAIEASESDMNWRDSWTDYGINAVFFENYWNDGSPREQRRWFDDIAIATTRIGCD